ncbi:MAG: SDR family oxidoreductase [Lachnospiraceae bacterium]|nr:SDR family oxidoreductase [Lachnospiraceae bacterium]
MRIKDKVAIVTGAANGIGAEISRTYAREGAHVVLADLAVEKAQTVADEITEETGIKAIAVKCNVASRDEVQAVVDAAVEAFGTVDIIVNNAGITLPACPVEDISPEQWKKVLDIDLMGTIYGTQCVIPVMRANGGGKIICMASIAGQVGGVFTEATYPVSKAGVICWAKAVAKQVGKDNITCNCIAPGTVLTAMTETLGSAEASLNVPLHRLGDVKDIANAALFLASYESDFITGATIDVNGGMGMR